MQAHSSVCGFWTLKLQLLEVNTYGNVRKESLNASDRCKRHVRNDINTLYWVKMHTYSTQQMIQTSVSKVAHLCTQYAAIASAQMAGKLDSTDRCSHTHHRLKR